jgi:hypothetical protein
VLADELRTLLSRLPLHGRGRFKPLPRLAMTQKWNHTRMEMLILGFT